LVDRLLPYDERRAVANIRLDQQPAAAVRCGRNYPVPGRLQRRARLAEVDRQRWPPAPEYEFDRRVAW